MLFEPDCEGISMRKSNYSVTSAFRSQLPGPPPQPGCPKSKRLHHKALKIIAYTPYGYSLPRDGNESNLTAFNGELLDKTASGYLLGSYRLYKPELMRFIKPDNYAPFAIGGINAYAYCAGDPINRADQIGHFWNSITQRWKTRSYPLRRSSIGGTSIWHADLRRYSTLENSLERDLPKELVQFETKRNKGWLDTFSVDQCSIHRLRKITWHDRFVSLIHLRCWSLPAANPWPLLHTQRWQRKEEARE